MNNKLMIGWSEADITPNTDKFISLADKLISQLSFSHLVEIMTVGDPLARFFYSKCCCCILHRKKL